MTSAAAVNEGVVREHHEVVIVGACFSGIGTAIALPKAGFHDILIVDDANGPGGVWHWDTYPGVAVDVLSFGYQFSFEQDSGWSPTSLPSTATTSLLRPPASRRSHRPRFAPKPSHDLAALILADGFKDHRQGHAPDLRPHRQQRREPR